MIFKPMKEKDMLRTKIVLTLVVSVLVFCNNIYSQPKKQPKSYFLLVKATAYCPCFQCCGKWSNGKTFKGTDANSAGVAVDRKIIPLNSHIDIPGYKRGPNKNGSWILCDDIGGAIKGNEIDVRFKTHEEALKWGIKHIRIRVWPSR